MKTDEERLKEQSNEFNMVSFANNILGKAHEKMTNNKWTVENNDAGIYLQKVNFSTPRILCMDSEIGAEGVADYINKLEKIILELDEDLGELSRLARNL